MSDYISSFKEKKKYPKETTRDIWKQNDRELSRILTLIPPKTDKPAENHPTHSDTSDKEDSFPKSLQEFLSRNEQELAKDPQTLQSLRNVIQGGSESALVALEKIAWNSKSDVSREAMDMFLSLLEDDKRYKLYSYSSLKDVLQLGSETLLFSAPQEFDERSSHLLFPSDSELNPPFKTIYPRTDSSSSDHLKYEEVILNKYHEKKLTERDVGWAFLNETAVCKHPAEMVVCHLHAAMWMAKELNPQSDIDFDTLYALKCIILRLLEAAFLLSLRYLNPGMQLYVARLIVGIIRKIARMPKSRRALKDGDSNFLQKVLKRLIKSSQLFPFWDPPAVSVSKAVTLNDITIKLHSSFMIGLQHLNPSKRPIIHADLTYQLHENDIRSILPLKNRSDSRARAMEKLLKSQGRSWNEVMQNMLSRLTSRDEQGWLIQSRKLEIQQQYSKLTGFIIEKGKEGPSSIKLLMVEADIANGENGLFSPEDISTIIQLDDLQSRLSFSLDPPDHDLTKRFHPFQQWKYTENLKDTEFLKTMFAADYLMKSFAVGSEVSSIPPFEQRSCKEGLTKDLPQSLQRAIRPLSERGSIDYPCRFWIEAKEISVGCERNDSRIKYHFGDMEMEVNSRPWHYQIDSTREDSDEDFDLSSPEAQFAEDMTKKYRDLEDHFPIFARLRELSKLQVFVNMLPRLLNDLNPFEKYKKITKTSCSKEEWVPAAIAHNPGSLVHGGVCFSPSEKPLSYGFRNPATREIPLVELIDTFQANDISHPSSTDYSAPLGNAMAGSSGSSSDWLKDQNMLNYLKIAVENKLLDHSASKGVGGINITPKIILTDGEERPLSSNETNIQTNITAEQSDSDPKIELQIQWNDKTFYSDLEAKFQ